MKFKSAIIYCLGIVVLLAAGPFYVRAADEGERDPFKSNIAPVLTTVDGEQPVISAILQGISISDKKSFAIINGIIFYENEEKSGIKVAKIKKKEVDIIVNGIAQTLQMVVRNRPPVPQEQITSEEEIKGSEEEKPSGEETHAL